MKERLLVLGASLCLAVFVAVNLSVCYVVFRAIVKACGIVIPWALS
jgi:hypothetical protein